MLHLHTGTIHNSMSKYLSIIITIPLFILLTISITRTTNAPTQPIVGEATLFKTPQQAESLTLSPEDKKSLFEKKLNENPNNKEATIELLKLYLNNINETKKAKQLLQEKEKILYHDSDFVAIKALSYIHQEEYQKALNTIDLISNPEGDYLKSIIYLIQNKPSEAQVILESLNDSQVSEKANDLLITYTEYGKHKGAPISYHKALIARKLLEQQEYKIAELLIKQALNEDNSFRDAWTILGFSLYAQKAYQESLDAYLKAYKLDKANAQVQYFIGNTYYHLNDYENSIKYLQFSLQNSPEEKENPKTISKLNTLKKIAENYLKLSNFQLAGHYFEKAIEEDPNDLPSYIQAVKIYLESTRYIKKAERIAKRAKQQFPNNAMSYNLLAWTQLEQGKNKEAIKNLENALQLDANLQDTYLSLGKAYEKENPERAKENYLKAKSIAPESESGIKAEKRYNYLLLN
jgi:tetratricopeptide (TPR) repeat protein